MQNVFNSLAVLAFLGAIVALFAFSALLKIVRELQQAALAGPTPYSGVREVSRFASQDGLPTFVLVVSEHCQSCRDRAARLASLPAGSVRGHLVMLSGGLAVAGWAEGADDVTVITEPELLGSIAVGVTPTLVKYATDGTEEWRRVVGSDTDLDRQLGLGMDIAQSSF
jgi:hypothetical protein